MTLLDGFGGHSVGQARSVHLRDGQYDILYHTVNSIKQSLPNSSGDISTIA